MSEPWGVLLFEKPSKAFELADDIAASLKLTRFDVIHGLRDDRNYILDYLDQDKAERVAQALVNGGVTAVALPQSAMDFPYASGAVRAAAIGEGSLIVVDPNTSKETTVPWSGLRAALAVHRQKTQRIYLSHMPGLHEEGVSRDVRDARNIVRGIGQALRDKNSLLGSLGGVLTDFMVSTRNPERQVHDRTLQAMLTSNSLQGPEDDVLLLVLGDDPVIVSAIERSSFNYGYLGERRAYSSRINFLEVMGDLARCGRPFYVNRPFMETLKEKKDEVPEKVKGKGADRWLRERLLMMDMLYKGRVPADALKVLDEQETLLFYLE